MIHTTTIVSAFLNVVGDRKDKTLHDYIEHGMALIHIKVPKIIFLDKNIYMDSSYSFQTIHNEDEYTHFIPIDINNLYFMQYKSDITEFHLRKHHPIKDTIEYMMIQCNKTEWMREAIIKNIFHTEQFLWIDFGIHCMFDSNELLQQMLFQASTKIYTTIRLPNIWYMGATHYSWDDIHLVDLYIDITWYFAGSVFGGNATSLLKLADLMRGKVVSIIQNKKTIIWETNCWYMIYLELTDKSFFDTYFGSHDSNILDYY